MFAANRKKLAELLERLGDIYSELETILDEEDSHCSTLSGDAQEAAEQTCESIDEALDGIGEAVDLIEELLDEE